MTANDIRIAIPAFHGYASSWASMHTCFEVYQRAENWRSARVLAEIVEVDEIPFEVEGMIRHINRVCAAKELGRRNNR